MRRSLRSWLWRVPLDEEVDEEIAFHVEMRTRELVERGMDSKPHARLPSACSPPELDPSESLTKLLLSCYKPGLDSEHPNPEFGRCNPAGGSLSLTAELSSGGTRGPESSSAVAWGRNLSVVDSTPRGCT
jgi:hypothetical protein